MKKTTYLVTGASGYVGSMLTDYLLRTEKDVNVIAPVRNLQKARERFAGFKVVEKEKQIGENRLSDRREDWKRLRLLQADLCDGFFAERFRAEIESIDCIIHCASVTASSEMVEHPVEVIKSIVNGTQNVLELARNYEIKSMVYLSSMEVYGDVDCSDGHRVTEREADSGRVELLTARSCYPLGKRMAEHICYSYFKEYGIPVKIVRLAQTFGRGLLPSDNRVYAQFARSVKSGIDIVLHTEGCSMGNYCGIDDTIDGILTVLERGENGEAYNVVNEENTMTIRQMAELVAIQAAGGKIGVRCDISLDNRYGYAVDTGLRLSGKKLSRLGWKPKKKLVEMYREVLEDMKYREEAGRTR